MGFQLQKEEMDGLCNCQTQAVERLLKTLQMKMAKCALRRAAPTPRPARAPPRSPAAAALASPESAPPARPQVWS